MQILIQKIINILHKQKYYNLHYRLLNLNLVQKYAMEPGDVLHIVMQLQGLIFFLILYLRLSFH